MKYLIVFDVGAELFSKKVSSVFVLPVSDVQQTFMITAVENTTIPSFGHAMLGDH